MEHHGFFKFSKLEDLALLETYFELREKREANNEAFWHLLSAKMKTSRFEIEPARCLHRIENLLQKDPSMLNDPVQGCFLKDGTLLRYDPLEEDVYSDVSPAIAEIQRDTDMHAIREKIWKDSMTDFCSDQSAEDLETNGLQSIDRAPCEEFSESDDGTHYDEMDYGQEMFAEDYGEDDGDDYCCDEDGENWFF
jgi:hypothetical protein